MFLKKLFADFVLFVLGFKLVGFEGLFETEKSKNFIGVMLNHTSNWDGFLTVAAVWSLKLNPIILVKKSVFKNPLFGGILKWMGMVPVERGRSTGMVKDLLSEMKRKAPAVILITPEGTRKKVDSVKKGFYWLSIDSGLPILLCGMHYGKKEINHGGFLHPTGDFESDFDKIKEFFANHTEAKYPDQKFC